MFQRAICRRPGPDLAGGLTTAGLGAPDFAAACRQHDAYVAALGDAGLAVTVLAALPGHPDACFVEDTAVIVPEVAVISRPGAASRRGETASVAAALAAHAEPVAIEAPGTLDGGDVLVADRTCWIGLSARTNADGARQLAAILAPHGYACRTVVVAAGLHLKTDVNHLGGRTLAVTPALADHAAFADCRRVVVPADEAYAANTLLVNGTLLTPAGYPQTRRLLDDLDVPVVPLELGEFRKLDGGLTCLSLRF